MDFFNKVEETITAKGQMVVDKAKQMAEIASLKSQISTCEDVIRKNYMEIGRLYYEKYGEEPSEEFEKCCNAIKNAKRGADELQDEIKALKGL